MPVLSHIHQLFNAEQCQAYIRMLRWQDRPLQCPRCQSRHIGQAHTNIAPGANATGAITASAPSTTSPRPYCIGARDRCHTGFSPPFCCALPVRRWRIARELGVHVRTSYRWCWWLRNAAVSYETLPPGTVEADDLYQTAGHKGQTKHGKAPGARARGRRKKREPGRGAMTKIGPRLLPGSVVRVCGHPRDQRFHREDGAEGGGSPPKRAAGSTRTRPAAIGR